MGDSSPPKSLGFCLDRLSPAFAGLRNLLCFDPGACAPGFLLAPASQAKTALLVQNGASRDTTLDALCESLNQPAVFSFESSLCSIARLQLAEDARHMILYCAFGEEECARDFSIAGTLRNKAKYLDFTFRQ